MYYNLNLFGNRLRQIRKACTLTQEEVSKLSGVNPETLRRIEGGKVLPKLDTLEILSPILKSDLHSVLIEYRLDDYHLFSEIKNRLELKYDEDNHTDLTIDINELKSLLPSIKNLYSKSTIKQLLLFTSAIVSYRKENNPCLALEQLVDGIKVFTPGFCLDSYHINSFSSMDFRILMNIAIVLNQLGDSNKYLEMMVFCFENADKNDAIFPKLCHNLAGVYTRQKSYNKALNYSIEGINWCSKNRNFNGLGLLYYSKGFCEYHLNDSNYVNSFKTSVNLCESFGQHNLKKQIVRNCEVFCNLRLN